MQCPARSLAITLLTVLALSLAACRTTPEKPVTTIVVPAPPLPATPTGPATPTAGGESGQAAGGRGEAYGPVVPDAADVTAEEVSADGRVRAVTDTAAPGTEDEAGAGGRAGGGGGRVPPKRFALPPEAGAGTGPQGAPTATRDAPDPAWRGSDFGGRDARVDDTVTAPPMTDLARAKREAAARLGVSSGLEDGRGGRLDQTQSARGAGGAADETTGLGSTPDQSGARDGRYHARPLAARALADEAVADEDVLAVQLREAAEREQDPVLREKLWVEYRRYRAGRDTSP